MKFEIKISESNNYLITKVIGEMNREVGAEIAMTAEEFGEKNNIKKVLIDLRDCINTDTVKSNIAFSNEDFPFPRKKAFKKMAELVSPDDNSHTLVIVSLANEGYNVRMFTDEYEAIEWLEKDGIDWW